MYGRKIVFIFTALLCLNVQADITSVEQIQIRWSSVFNKEVNKNFLTRDPITAPNGARVVLARVDLLTKNFKKISDCLIYQIPGTNTTGELFFIQSKIDKTCEEQTFAKPYFVQKEIFNLKLEERMTSLRMFIDQQKISFNFYNIINSKINNDSAEHQFKVPGVLVSFIDSPNSQKILNEFEVCSEVPSNECSEKTKDLCHLCPGGNSYQVVASDCSKSLRKYCGHKECGVIGSPACLRGRRSSGYKGTFCITDSPMGFCEKPSRVVCLNNELYCR